MITKWFDIWFVASVFGIAAFLWVDVLQVVGWFEVGFSVLSKIRLWWRGNRLLVGMGGSSGRLPRLPRRPENIFRFEIFFPIFFGVSFWRGGKCHRDYAWKLSITNECTQNFILLVFEDKFTFFRDIITSSFWVVSHASLLGLPTAASLLYHHFTQCRLESTNPCSARPVRDGVRFPSVFHLLPHLLDPFPRQHLCHLRWSCLLQRFFRVWECISPFRNQYREEKSSIGRERGLWGHLIWKTF